MAEASRASSAKDGSPLLGEDPRRVLDGLLEGCIVLGFGWKCLYVNEAGARILRSTREELAGRNILEVIPGAAERTAFGYYRRCMEERIPLRYEDSFTFANGTRSWWDVSVTPVPEGIVVHGVETTDRKLVEEELRASRALLGQVLDSVPQAIFWKDTEGVYIGCNEPFARAAGLKGPEQIVGKTDFDLPWPREDAEAYRADDAQVVSTGSRMPHIVEQIRLADGTQLWIDTTKVPMAGAGGEVQGVIGVFEDITERKRTEEALRESETRLREVLENSLSASYKRDLRSNDYVYFSPVFARITGYTTDEMKSLPLETVVNLIHPDDGAELRRVLAEATSGGHGKAFRLDYRFRHKNGQYRWLEDEFTVLRGPTGQPDALIGSVSDVTDRKRAEEDLRESEEKHRKIIETIHDGIWVVDAERRTVFVNPRMAEMLGYGQEEMVGRPLVSFLPEEARSDAEARLRLQQERVSESYEQTYVRKDGSRVSALLSTAPVLDRDGSYGGAVAVVTDITDRKRAEMYLDMRRAVLQELNEPGTLEDSIRRVVDVLKRLTGFDAVGIRLEAGEDFPYLAQDGFSESFLKTESSLVERGPDGRERRDGDGKVRLECTCGLVISGETDPSDPAFTAGGSFWTNDSSRLPDIPAGEDPRRNPRNLCIRKGYASVALVPIRCGARILGLIHLDDRRKGHLSLDMVAHLERLADHIGTAMVRKQAEAALRQLNTELDQMVKERTVELEAANRELDSFSHSVSHDLRAPVRAIDGFAKLLEDHAGGVLDGEGRRLLATVRKSSLRMGNLIDDLLAFSRAGRTELHLREVDMARAVSEALSEVLPEERREQVEVRIGELPSVRGDRALLRQVVLNLVQNAVKFSGMKERPVVEIGSLLTDGEVEYFIRDNGAGFDPRHGGKLFGVFQRLHSERDFPGTGVGLSLVKRIVERHGGRVWAEGEVGKGATFHFTLPVTLPVKDVSKMAGATAHVDAGTPAGGVDAGRTTLWRTDAR